MEPYDANNHRPNTLPCHHTFCRDCLNSLPTHEHQITCPVCRSDHEVPPDGYPTNRAVLDIVEELKKLATCLKCLVHLDEECILVCIDCLDGLCLKCIKQNLHQGHHLEELSDAKTVLKQKVEERKSILESEITNFNKSPHCLAEIERAEVDIRQLSNGLIANINSWVDEQLVITGDLKVKSSDIEKAYQTEKDLLDEAQTDMEKMMINIKLWKATDQMLGNDTQNEVRNYQFGTCCQQLLLSLQTMLNSDSISSKVLRKPSNAGSTLETMGAMNQHEAGSLRRDPQVEEDNSPDDDTQEQRSQNAEAQPDEASSYNDFLKHAGVIFIVHVILHILVFIMISCMVEGKIALVTGWNLLSIAEVIFKEGVLQIASWIMVYGPLSAYGHMYGITDLTYTQLSDAVNFVFILLVCFGTSTAAEGIVTVSRWADFTWQSWTTQVHCRRTQLAHIVQYIVPYFLTCYIVSVYNWLHPYYRNYRNLHTGN